MEPEFVDPALTREQAALCSQLTGEQLAAIDAALLSHCSSSWRKVAFVVGAALHEAQLPGVPDVFFGQRLKAQVARGRLEGRGDFSRMGYSEVRIPAVSVANAP